MYKQSLMKVTGIFLSIMMVLVPFLTQYQDVNAVKQWNMEYFLANYSDWHFNLETEPERVMTIEEYIALMHAYSYYGGGAETVTATDKNGNLPSAWCAKYVQAEVNKKVIDPERISWSDPVTIGFAAQFLARSKGKYSYDSNNIYDFSGTEKLSTDDILYLSVAVDHGLISYTPGMDVSQTIKRKDARKYEVPEGQVSALPMISGNTNTMRECNVYFIDCYWELDKANEQFSYLKKNGEHITMVTFQCAYINGTNVSEGNSFLGCDIEHEEAVELSEYKEDPQLSAIEYCKANGKMALLGVSNVANNAFSGDCVAQLLESESNMDTAVREIIDVVEEYDLDGVNMGMEVVSENYSHLRVKYNLFLKKLADDLHAQGKVLLVSIAAYFEDKTEQKSIYDYSYIGEIADYVHVILYDDFTDTAFSSGYKYGPMSNMKRCGRCLRYAVSKIESDKILFGLGAYAIDFNFSWGTAQDLNYQDSVALRVKYLAPIMIDNSNDAMGAYFEYVDEARCRHRVYLETADTIAPKGDLVKSYNLGGFSVFNVNDDYKELFMETTKISSYKPEIVEAIKYGVVPLKLRADYAQPILRHEFCSIVVALIESKTNISAERFLKEQGITKNSNAFNDISAATSENDVLIANALGIVKGYGNNEFRPMNTITRQEAAAMLMRLAKVMGMDEPNSDARSFDELPSLQEWAVTGINFVSSCVDSKSGKRVMGGTGNNKFSPFATYTREQSFMSALRLLNAMQ